MVAKGQKLTIRLMHADGSFLSKMAMNFFCPIPKGTPINPDGINSFASFGPYYVASRQVGRQLITKTNPNYKGQRPHNVSTFVFTMNTNLDQSLLQVKSGQADYDAGGLPSTANAGLAQQYGVHKGGPYRYFVNGGLNVDYIAMNTTRPAFSSVGHAEGGELRGRPPGTRPGPRLPRGQALAIRSCRRGSTATSRSTRTRSRAANYPKAKALASAGRWLQGRHAVHAATPPSARTWRRSSSTT